jgi:LPS sulfotransferase NodH
MRSTHALAQHATGPRPHAAAAMGPLQDRGWSTPVRQYIVTAIGNPFFIRIDRNPTLSQSRSYFSVATKIWVASVSLSGASTCKLSVLPQESHH